MLQKQLYQCVFTICKINKTKSLQSLCDMYSVRVSNELGATHPRTAKFAVVVVVITSFLIGLVLSAILIIFRKQYPALFSDSEEVEELVDELTPLLAFCIVINNVQPVLSGIFSFLSCFVAICRGPINGTVWSWSDFTSTGVAIGAGWQAFVAWVNIACYYLFGVPLGLVLGYKVGLGVKVTCTMLMPVEGKVLIMDQQ